MRSHALALVLVAIPPALPAQDPIEIERALVLPRLTRGGRAAVFTDPVEAMLAAGTWQTPTEGLEVEGAGGRTATWKAIEAKDGQFRDRALGGGYAYAEVTVERDGVWLLDARGHRHVYVNGQPHTGDVYDLGFYRMPVALRAGTNALLFRGGRGSLRATLTPPPADAYVEPRDAVLPHLLDGVDGPLLGGVAIGNATDDWARDLILEVTGDDVHSWRSAIPPLPPATHREIPFEVHPAGRGDDRTEITVAVRRGDDELHRETFTLEWRSPHQNHRRTFASRIDGSTQYFGVTPPPEGSEDARSLFLSLHGASVEALHQSNCYQPKDDGYVVAPTNRRRFGFDWEDWGRMDALEVLELASEMFAIDPRRTYATGHSMGGHGTWSLGAHCADRFAALGPSAGWRDFWAYGGGVSWEDPTPVQAVLDRAANVSRTLLLLDNYRHHGIYVLHGDADRTVGVDQARFMREQLAKFHPNFAYYERPGAGHWWGNQCMDWPPLFDLLRANVLPEPHQQTEVKFTIVNPAIHATGRWMTVMAQHESLQPSTFGAAVDGESRKVTVTTDNVARLRLDLNGLTTKPGDEAGPLPAGEPITLVVNETELETTAWPADGVVHLAIESDGARVTEAPAPSLKHPMRAGPFKEAFRNRMVFVVGTAGDDAHDRWALDKARYDAETFWYRGNGSVEVTLDTDFDATAEPDRNVILYGNAETNAAWHQVLADCPIGVGLGRMRVGERDLAGDDLACFFVWPRTGSDTASVGVICGTGIPGARTAMQVPHFVSGAGFPDWLVLGSEMLREGSRGVRGAGFFGHDWSLARGTTAWRD